MRTVIGRDRELRSIERLLDEGRTGFSALLIAGDAGIGKTTVWQEAVRLGEDAGLVVLRCRPTQAEATLGFSALSDLLSTVGEDVLAALPEPQRHGIDAALLRAAPTIRGSASRAVAAGLLSVLRRLADETPVLVAIDDVQWLDRASEAALAFALRRIEADLPISLVVAQRVEGAQAQDPLGFAQLPTRARERVVLGPLSLSALHHVIRDQLGIVVPRPTLQRIEEASGGNPLLALEIARALAVAGERPQPGAPLPVPGEISALFAERLARLPEDSRTALLSAALLGDPAVLLVEGAVGQSAEQSLEHAVDAGLIDFNDGRVRFVHPLVGASVASSAGPRGRREMHRRLAEIVPSREERARHLALGSEGADEAVAAGLEEAAGLAERRGASEDAAELLELASQLTPRDDGVSLAHRQVELARLLIRAGDMREATRILDGVLEQATKGSVRARALELRAHVHWVAGTAEEAMACCEEALAQVGDDDELRASVLITLGDVTRDRKQAPDHYIAAVDLLEGLDDPDPGLLSRGLGGIAYFDGRIANSIVERALELERIAPPANVSDRTSAALGTWLKYDGDFDGARRWLEATRQAAVDEGDEGSLPYALSHLPQIELWTGNWTRSEELALEHLELAEITGQSGERLTAISSLAFVYAHDGRVDEARELVERALPDAEAGDPWGVYLLLSALGFVELTVGAAAEAVASLRRAYDIYEATGHAYTPSVFENYPEALILVGELELAAQVIDVFERRTRETGKAITLAPALRCRALLLAAQGVLDDAHAAVEEALAQHELVDMPFSRARTLVVHGQILRRRGERRAARSALEEALAVFEELGSPHWAEKARSELARLSIRRGSGDELTAAEARVAELVSQGKSNDEVAQELFVSRKTVEANLTRIYRKLGLRSRSALAARASGRDTGNEPAEL